MGFIGYYLAALVLLGVTALWLIALVAIADHMLGFITAKLNEKMSK